MKQLQLFHGLWLTGAVTVIAAQPVWAQQVTQITAVRLNQTPSGLEVILDTANGVKPHVFTSSSKQTFVADIANAQLRLPQGNEFRANKPAKGISAIAVTNLNTNSVRVTVAGTAGVPAVEVLESNAAGLIFSLKPAPVAAAEEEINVVVTGWRNRLQALYVGDRNLGFESGADEAPIEDYFVVDYISSIQLGAGSLQIGIQNLFDNQYFPVRSQISASFGNTYNLAAPGRTLSIGYRITW